MPMPQVPFDDRGLAYGDGVFETVLLRDGVPVLWDYHLARLEQGCRRLNIPLPTSQQLAQVWQSPPAAALEVLKLILTRGSGGRGYALPDHPEPRLIFRRTPFVTNGQRWQHGVCVRLCHLRLGHQPLLAGIKHLNRLENVLARQEWQESHIAEGLLADQSGEMVEATSMNLFWSTEGRLLTPRVNRCGVAGTLRAALLANGVIEEEGLTVSELPQVERLWVGNSVQGVWPVCELLDTQGGLIATWPVLAGPDPLQREAHRLLGYPSVFLASESK
ncbi:aminodeoxychorismate lyase [Vreelandella lionensis]|uniref:Aminodeoxychorismate lyase n=1 Tax=Vreelandella lionensis TaxID=1144478 RepID=A0ABW8BU34_9GAMM